MTASPTPERKELTPLAKLWTWTGHIYLPIALAWAIYVTNGLPVTDELPHPGVLISRGYWGLLASLAAGAMLIWTWAEYAKHAREHAKEALIPPDTTFEELDDRSLVISYGSAVVVFAGLIFFTVMFAGRYGDSRIYLWDAGTPLADHFFNSRYEVYFGTEHGPFAIAARLETGYKPYTGVNQYIPYLTDGILIVLVILILMGIVRLKRMLKRPPVTKTEDPEQSDIDRSSSQSERAET